MYSRFFLMVVSSPLLLFLCPISAAKITCPAPICCWLAALGYVFLWRCQVQVHKGPSGHWHPSYRSISSTWFCNRGLNRIDTRFSRFSLLPISSHRFQCTQVVEVPKCWSKKIREKTAWPSTDNFRETFPKFSRIQSTNIDILALKCRKGQQKNQPQKHGKMMEVVISCHIYVISSPRFDTVVALLTSLLGSSGVHRLQSVKIVSLEKLFVNDLSSICFLNVFRFNKKDTEEV